ncbi:hypothetical protein PspLS_03964 [Pyricularia sp. CBS 133598]|nr:hypothetical protein PspLS_03964 [Pyricularia sp. CBS 133598]
MYFYSILPLAYLANVAIAVPTGGSTQGHSHVVGTPPGLVPLEPDQNAVSKYDEEYCRRQVCAHLDALYNGAPSGGHASLSKRAVAPTHDDYYSLHVESLDWSHRDISRGGYHGRNPNDESSKKTARVAVLFVAIVVKRE